MRFRYPGVRIFRTLNLAAVKIGESQNIERSDPQLAKGDWYSITQKSDERYPAPLLCADACAHHVGRCSD